MSFIHIIKTIINGKDCTHTALCCCVVPKDVAVWVDVNQADFSQVTCTECLAEVEKRKQLFEAAEIIKAELKLWSRKELGMLYEYFLLPDEDGDPRMAAFNALCEKFGDDIFALADKAELLLEKYRREGKEIIQIVLYHV